MVHAAHRRHGEGQADAPVLDPAALLTLQLAARDHTLRQIAALRAVDVADVLEDLRRAVEALEVSSARGAVDEAKRRGLIG